VSSLSAQISSKYEACELLQRIDSQMLAMISALSILVHQTPSLCPNRFSTHKAESKKDHKAPAGGRTYSQFFSPSVISSFSSASPRRPQKPACDAVRVTW
jgi:hypothetical protein